ncbi:MAG: universal stress protein [Chloroflexi bacterium]|nr:universal stress protein [Chloroflexota bacterium]
MTFATILVPLDGSPLAERAIPFARGLALAARGRLVLLRVTSIMTESKLEARAYLDAIADRARTNEIAVEAEISVAAEEEVAQAIGRAVREQQAGLIAMSTHGRSGLGRWIYGSVADQVLRSANVPVLLVPAACQAGWPGDRVRRILLPLDGSDLATEALGPAGELADLFGAELLLLQSVELPSYTYVGPFPYPPFDLDAVLAAAQEYLETVAADLRAHGRTVAVRTAAGNPAFIVADTAREQGAEVIAMATHGRTGLARLVMGSVATGTVQRASVPLLLVHPTALDRAESSIAAQDARPAER